MNIVSNKTSKYTYIELTNGTNNDTYQTFLIGETLSIYTSIPLFIRNNNGDIEIKYTGEPLLLTNTVNGEEELNKLIQLVLCFDNYSSTTPLTPTISSDINNDYTINDIFFSSYGIIYVNVNPSTIGKIITNEWTKILTGLGDSTIIQNNTTAATNTSITMGIGNNTDGGEIFNIDNYYFSIANVNSQLIFLSNIASNLSFTSLISTNITYNPPTDILFLLNKNYSVGLTNYDFLIQDDPTTRSFIFSALSGTGFFNWFNNAGTYNDSTVSIPLNK